MTVCFRRSAPLGILLALTLSCSSTPRGLQVQPFDASPLSFDPCPSSVGGPSVECARVRVPVNWEEPQEEQLTVLLRRIRSTEAPRGQLWALDGGPGFAGDIFLDPLFADRVTRSGLDLYIPSHRGTQDESTLHCPDEQSPDSEKSGFITADEWPSCVAHLQDQWGDSLAHFNSTQAAADVSHLMDRMKTEDRVLVFGGSYGSIWGQRLLQHRPSGIDRMLLDSVVDLEASLEGVDSNTDAVMRSLLEACGEIPACAARFDETPVAAAETALLAFSDGNGCGQLSQSESLERTSVQKLMARLVSGAPHHWVVATAAYARLARCEAKDIEALSRALTQLSAPPASAAADGFAYSPPLNRHILFRELFRFDDVESIAEDEQASLLASDRGGRSVAEESKAFGESWRSVGATTIPETNTPLHLLSGGLDPLDPPSWAKTTAARWPNSQLISTFWAGHGVLRYLGLSAEGLGTQLFDDFLLEKPLNQSAAEATSAPDFSGATPEVQEAAQLWFGTDLF